MTTREPRRLCEHHVLAECLAQHTHFCKTVTQCKVSDSPPSPSRHSETFSSSFKSVCFQRGVKISHHTCRQSDIDTQ